MKIIKASGEITQYNRDKIIHSLKRAGATEAIIEDVLSATEKELFNGIQTKAMYKILYRNLKKISRSIAGKYHLKSAIMELGPSGFPFEKFVAALFEAEGYHTKVDQLIEGHCIAHEVDVHAEKDGDEFTIECKFHGSLGSICDVKKALYVYARTLDIGKAWKDQPNHSTKTHRGWLVTNTRFSKDALKYGNCVGLGLMSWDYPHKGSLRKRIDTHGLHPLTCLTSLSTKEKQALLNRNIVLCQSVCKQPGLLNEIGLSPEKRKRILKEAEAICYCK